MNKNKLTMMLTCLLLLVAVGMQAQGEYRDARNRTLGLRINGGASWSFNSPFENIHADTRNLTQPLTSAGLIYNIRPWVRIGADHSYTTMVREQLLSSLQPIAGENMTAGSEAGTVYRDLKTNFNTASLTGELNLVDLICKKNSGRFSIWLGAGVGYLFAKGNTWSVNISNEMRNDNWTQTVHFGGNNESHSYNALYIPVTLSLEYAVLPNVAISVGGGLNYLPSKKDLAPREMAYAKAGLVFNITGKKYREKYRKQTIIEAPAIHDTIVVEKVVEKIVQAPAAKANYDITLPYVTFERGSSVLDEMTNASALATLVSVLKADKDVKFDIVGWTDHTGTDAINEPLSQSRAGVLRDYLVSQGIDPSRIGDVIGKGTYPIEGKEAFSVIARRAEAVIKK